MRFLARLCIFVALLWGAAAQAQVVFDAAMTTDSRSSGVSSVTVAAGSTLTVGSGSNRALLVGVSLGDNANARTVTSVTWDSGASNQGMTLITGAAQTFAGANHMRVELWGLIAPTSGNKALNVVLSGVETDVYISAVSYTGVNQGGVNTGTFAHGTGLTGGTVGTPTAPSIPVTSATNDAAVAAWIVDAANITATGNTQIYFDNNGTVSNAAMNRDVGAATVTLTLTPNQEWAAVGVDVVAAGAGAACPPPSLALLGVGC